MFVPFDKSDAEIYLIHMIGSGCHIRQPLFRYKEKSCIFAALITIISIVLEVFLRREIGNASFGLTGCCFRAKVL